MENLRFTALKEALSKNPVNFTNNLRASDVFGMNVFDKSKMRQYLSTEAYHSVRQAVDEGKRIPRRMADAIAVGMKSWAIEKGATHYTHWFHPLTEASAEKHDSFFEPAENGGVLERFSGDMLVQQEPDASSFPSGGIRNTFEARGYTAWDPSSPAFILGKTLCIPTVFISYTGEALDFKTPLLRSLHALDKAASAVCQMFDKDVKKVIATLGWEQEYFLIDESLYNARPDLMLTGRTLLGHASAKDQQLEDHYFASIPERVHQYMMDYETEAWKLGIPVKTRHNEVAPNQFECAPIFEEANLAVDHNMLLMDIMNRVARRHGFKVLFHEKPFSGINGSGKHNNWSMMTDQGRNLLAPGKTPKMNLQFLTFVVNVVKAVSDHADLIRASIASLGNENRLGGNEAPPAIMSVFLGTRITSVLNEIEKRVTGKTMTPDEKTALKLDIGKIPEILLDNTDRNRTSPFAFTGNRFEFRAVGSSANCAAPMIALNTAVANQLAIFQKEVTALTRKKIKKDEAILQVLRQYIKSNKRILFEGNGYSEEWVKEALSRGLSNIRETPEALKAFISKMSIDLFEKNAVFSERELYARYDIRLEYYTKKLQIESRVLGNLIDNHIIPTAIRYQNLLLENLRSIREVFPAVQAQKMSKTQLQLTERISEHIEALMNLKEDMEEARKMANPEEDIRKKATEYCRRVQPFMQEIRNHCDKLELIVDNPMWPLPKYRELLFVR